MHVDSKTNYSLQEIIQKQEKHLKEQRGVLFLARYFIWPFVILIASICFCSFLSFPLLKTIYGSAIIVFWSGVLSYSLYEYKTDVFENWSYLNEAKMNLFYALCDANGEFHSYKESIMKQGRLPIGHELCYLKSQDRKLFAPFRYDFIKSTDELEKVFLNTGNRGLNRGKLSKIKQ